MTILHLRSAVHGYRVVVVVKHNVSKRKYILNKKRCIRAMLGRINFEKRSSAMPSAISQTSGLFGKVCCRRPMRDQYAAPAEYGSPVLLVESGPVNVSGISCMPNAVDWRIIHHHYTGLGKAHTSCETVLDF